MGKYEVLEKIQKLKESGAITEAEFEKEKERILKADNENIQNSNRKKKKGGKGILAGIIIVVIIIIGITVGINKARENRIKAEINTYKTYNK